MEWKKINEINTVEGVVEANAKRFGLSLADFLADTTFEIPGINRVNEVIYNFIKEEKPIKIVGDYDVDGLMASSIMHLFISSLGGKVCVRIPRRLSEGYGLNDAIVDELFPEEKTDALLITVDNGIKAHTAIEKAKAKGVTVILTDHHEPDYDNRGNEVIPKADIVIDPHLKSIVSNSGFEEYCGAAIAYKIAEAYLGKDSELAKKLYVYAAIATIADVVPLYGENRTIVKRGLKLINSGVGTTGLEKLLKKTWITGHVSEEKIGFDIAPMLNAPGRLEDRGGLKVMELLGIDKDRIRENQLLDQISELNDKRKKLVHGYMCSIQSEIGSNPVAPIVIKTTAPEGIIGILAAKVKEEYKTPALIFTKTDKGLKGSGRGTDDIHLYELLDRHKELFIGYGGHKKAAGFLIAEENFEPLKAALQEDLAGFKASAQEYNLDIALSSVEMIFREEQKYGPYGEGNPNPIVCIKGVNASEYTEIKAQHLKIQVNDNVAIMGYYMLDKYKEMLKPKYIDVIGALSSSWFKDKETITLSLIDFKPSEGESEIKSLEEMLITEGLI